MAPKIKATKAEIELCFERFIIDSEDEFFPDPFKYEDLRLSRNEIVYTLKDFPMQYGMTQNNLRNAYLTLGEVEDKAANRRKAVAACNEALKVYTLRDFPEVYNIISGNLRSMDI